jgi:hypothetical protein
MRNDDIHLPERFCREFADAKNAAAQITNYMAVVAGIKPLLDDWIPAEAMDAFASACAKYNLLFRTDAVFERKATDEELKSIKDGESLTTTKWFGARYQPGISKGLVHVFVARTGDDLEKGFRAGWYPLIIGSDVTFMPFINMFRFGVSLGYPECCCVFFMLENPGRSFIYTVLKNTRGRPNYLCNCMLKDNVYSYIYHMPCSFDCAESVRYAEALRKVIQEREPRFAAEIDKRLKSPLLVFEERFAYYFDGRFDGDGTISYDKAFFAGNPGDDRYGDLLGSAGRLEVHDDEILLFKNKRQVSSIIKKNISGGFLLDFGD